MQLKKCFLSNSFLAFFCLAILAGCMPGGNKYPLYQGTMRNAAEMTPYQKDGLKLSLPAGYEEDTEKAIEEKSLMAGHVKKVFTKDSSVVSVTCYKGLVKNTEMQNIAEKGLTGISPTVKKIKGPYMLPNKRGPFGREFGLYSVNTVVDGEEVDINIWAAWSGGLSGCKYVVYAGESVGTGRFAEIMAKAFAKASGEKVHEGSDLGSMNNLLIAAGMTAEEDFVAIVNSLR